MELDFLPVQRLGEGSSLPSLYTALAGDCPRGPLQEGQFLCPWVESSPLLANHRFCRVTPAVSEGTWALKLKLWKGSFFLLLTKLANINKILILAYVGMLFGNHIYALLLGMENDSLLQKENLTMCIRDITFNS